MELCAGACEWRSIYLFIYLPAFLDTGLPRGNVDERDSGEGLDGEYKCQLSVKISAICQLPVKC